MSHHPVLKPSDSHATVVVVVTIIINGSAANRTRIENGQQTPIHKKKTSPHINNNRLALCHHPDERVKVTPKVTWYQHQEPHLPGLKGGGQIWGWNWRTWGVTIWKGFFYWFIKKTFFYKIIPLTLPLALLQCSTWYVGPRSRYVKRIRW